MSDRSPLAVAVATVANECSSGASYVSESLRCGRSGGPRPLGLQQAVAPPMAQQRRAVRGQRRVAPQPARVGLLPPSGEQLRMGRALVRGWVAQEWGASGTSEQIGEG